MSDHNLTEKDVNDIFRDTGIGVNLDERQSWSIWFNDQNNNTCYRITWYEDDPTIFQIDCSDSSNIGHTTNRYSGFALWSEDKQHFWSQVYPDSRVEARYIPFSWRVREQ